MESKTNGWKLAGVRFLTTGVGDHRKAGVELHVALVRVGGVSIGACPPDRNTGRRTQKWV